MLAANLHRFPRSPRRDDAVARLTQENRKLFAMVEKLNGREMYRKGAVTGISNAATFRAAAEYLVDAGWLVKLDDRNPGIPGRSKADYTVNPLVYERAAR